MVALAREAADNTRVYLVGGTSAVLLGWRPSTMDIDLVIRPGGEKRISNFLLWQAAYAEFVFIETLWPDFGHAHLAAALSEYGGRDRRFGGIRPEADAADGAVARAGAKLRTGSS